MNRKQPSYSYPNSWSASNVEVSGYFSQGVPNIASGQEYFYADGTTKYLSLSSNPSYPLQWKTSFLETFDTNLPIFVDDSTSLVAYLKGDDSMLKNAYNANTKITLPSDSLVSSVSETWEPITENTVDASTLPVIATETDALVKGNAQTDTDTDPDTETITQPQEVPDTFPIEVPEIVVQEVANNVVEPSIDPDVDPLPEVVIDPLPNSIPTIDPQPSASLSPIDEIQSQPNDDETTEPITNFGFSLQDFFPFCIPKDIANLVRAFKADAVAPVFEIPFTFERLGINYTLVLDISKFDNFFEIARNFQIITFILALMFATKKFI